MNAVIKSTRGGQEIVALEEGHDFLARTPVDRFKHTFLLWLEFYKSVIVRKSAAQRQTL